MKKLMFAILCSVGVGLTLMASPAQVSDDNNAVAAQDQSVTEKPVAPVRHAKGLIKHEWKVKKVDFTGQNAPKRIGQLVGHLDPKWIIEKAIINDPVPSGPPIIHPNRPPKPINDELLSGNNNPGSVSGRPTVIRPDVVNPQIHTLGGSTHIVNDPIEPKDPGGHTNGYKPHDLKLLDK